MRTREIIELEGAIKRERRELIGEQAALEALLRSDARFSMSDALLEDKVERVQAIKRSLEVAKADLRRLKSLGGTWAPLQA